MERKNAWKDYSEADLKELEALCSSYQDFLSDCKTERECTSEVIKLAKEKGYILGGRLADYRYYNMDKVIENALKTAEEIL